MEQGEGKKVNGWRLLSLGLIVVIAGMIGVFFVSRGGAGNASGNGESGAAVADASGESTDADAGEDADVTSGTNDTGSSDAAQTDGSADAATETSANDGVYVEKPDVYPIRVTFADGFHYERIPGAPIYLKKGFSNPQGETVAALTTDARGKVSATVPAGEYTLLWGDDNYYDGYENITIGGDDGPGHDYCSDSNTEYAFWKFLVPRQKGNAIVMVLEWKGDEDLDLCVFNASEKRYINAVQPMDAAGDYLIDDDGEGSPGWEVVVIKDHTKGDVYTPYIRDGNSLKNGSFSSMEAKGVRFSVINSNGLMFSEEANPSERAALWCPCYVYQGKVIKDGNYEYDPSRYAWAAYEKY